LVVFLLIISAPVTFVFVLIILVSLICFVEVQVRSDFYMEKVFQSINQDIYEFIMQGFIRVFMSLVL